MGVIYPFQFAPLKSNSSHLCLHQGAVVVLDSYCHLLIALFGQRWQIGNCFFVICDDRCRGGASLSNDTIIIRQFTLAACIGLRWPFADGIWSRIGVVFCALGIFGMQTTTFYLIFGLSFTWLNLLYFKIFSVYNSLLFTNFILKLIYLLFIQTRKGLPPNNFFDSWTSLITIIINCLPFAIYNLLFTITNCNYDLQIAITLFNCSCP